MSTRQGNRFSPITKVGGICNIIFPQNGGRENIAKHKDQGNTATHGDVVPVKNGLVHYGIECYACQTMGHYSDKCTRQIETIFSQTGIIL